MATAVQIQISVDPTDAAAKIGAVKNELTSVGEAAAGAGVKGGQALDQMSGHAATSLDSVRLLSQEFGLRMPRAIEAMLSRMPAVTSALSSMIGGLGVVAAIEIFARLGEAIYKAFDMGGERARALQKALADNDLEMRRMTTDVDVQIDKLQEQQAKIEHKPFQNGMKLALDEAAQAADAMAQKLDAINQKFGQDVGKIGGNWVQRNINFSDSGGNTKYEQTMLQEHQKHLDEAVSPQDQLKEETSYANSLQIRLKELQQMQKTAPGSGVNYSNEVEGVQRLQGQQQKEADYINKGITRDAAEAKLQSDQAAQPGIEKAKQAAAEAARRREETTKEMARLQAEANEAGVRDDQLATQKRLAEIGQVEERLKQLHATTTQIAEADALINKKYDDERTKQLTQQMDQAQKALRDAQSAGLTGIAKIEADRNAHNEDIDASNAPTPVKAIQHQTVNYEADQRAGEYYQNADIEEAVKQSEAQKKAQEDHDRILDEEAAYAKTAAEAERRVRGDGIQGWVSDYRNAVAAIEAQDADSTTKLKGQLAEGKIDFAAYSQMKADADSAANSEIEAQTQDLQHKIAGTLESAFKDPVGTIKSMMEKMFLDILSGWIAHLGIFKGVFGQALDGITPGGGAGAGAVAGVGSAVGSIFGGGGGRAVAGVADAGSTTQFRPAYTGSAGTGVSGSIGSPSSTPVSGGIAGAHSGSSAGGFNVGGVLSTAHSLSGLFPQVTSTAANAPAMPAIPGTTDSAGMLSLSGNGTTDPAQDPTTPNLGNGLPGSFAGTAANVAGGTSGAISSVLGIAGGAAAGFEGEQATVNAFKTGNALQGALGDASAGAALGTVVGGPVGAAIGAGIGAAVGLASGALGAVTGMAGKIQARDYYNNSVFPQLEADRQSPSTAGISDVDRAASSAFSYMQVHFGAEPAEWVKDQYMDKEVASVVAEITNRAKGGAGYIGASAAEFHMGGYVSDFGDLATSTSEGFAKLLLGESVNTQQATSLHAPVINAMNSGASPSDVAAMYLKTMRPSGSNASGAQSGGDTHFHVHTLDTKTMTGWLRGGGARMISKAQNDFAGQYAGDGIVG